MPRLSQILSVAAAAALATRANAAVKTEDFVCSVPTSYSQAELVYFAERNCAKVEQAIKDITIAYKDGIYVSEKQKDAWVQKTGRAWEVCQESKQLLENNADVKQAANLAINAWGTVMMKGKECCTLLNAPYCIDREVSGALVAGLTPFFILGVLFNGAMLTSLFCLPRNAKKTLVKAGGIASGSSDAALPPPTDTVTSLLGRLSKLCGRETSCVFQKDLEDRWLKESCLRELPGAEGAAKATAALFSSLQNTFDFQPDSVRNQFEHLVSLWRSQVAMVADRDVGAHEKVNEVLLLGTALGDLHAELLDGFLKWRAKLSAYEPSAVPSRDPVDLNMLGGAPRVKLTGLPDATAEVPDADVDIWLSSCLEEVATFLLVWGEAGNVRFMPEVLYFITDMALAAEKSPSADRAAPGTGRSNHFLASVIRPLYNTVFDEWYESVTVADGKEPKKDVKKLHFGYDNFLPANTANYDDWNELFIDPERLVAGILLKDGTHLFNLPHKDRYAALMEVDWPVSLLAASSKTHREVHSLWGAFASTHRVWLAHSVLFLYGLCIEAQPPPETLGGRPLAGQSLAMRLAGVSLILPIHAMMWWRARWQITGSALRPPLCEHLTQVLQCKPVVDWFRKVCSQPSCFLGCKMVLCSPPDIIAFFPIGTYALVRGLDDGDDSLSSKVIGLLVLHFIVSLFALLNLLLVPADGFNQWTLTPVPVRHRIVRYFFWLCIFSVKFVAGLAILKAVHTAIDGLNIARLGHQSTSELSSVLLTTSWWANMLVWIVIWSTTFILFNCDTQLWFTLACTVLGVLNMFKQRRWHSHAKAWEHNLSHIPKRFSEKILTYASRPNRKSGAKETAEFSSVFPFIWDRVVTYMRYEDDIDSHTMAELAFNAKTGRDHVRWDHLRQPLKPSAGMRAPTHMPGSTSTVLRVKLPSVFSRKNPSETCFKTYCFMPDPHEPSNDDVRWRISALGRGLALPMPRPYRAPFFPGITVLIPHYGEQILVQKKELLKEDRGSDVPLIHWLKQKYADEFLSFTNRMKARSTDWPVAGDQWDEYTDYQWDKVTYWASMRLQTLWRTVAGMCYYYPALQCHFEAQADRESSLAKEGVWKPEECFTCMVSMQMYKFFDKTQLEHTNRMFDKFPPCFKVAFIDCKDKGEGADRDTVHPSQARRYFSCLIDAKSETEASGRKKPHFTIELPGYPILGDGKGDNQNHAIPFMRGHYSQGIDANQGAYFEQMMMLPCALGEFRSNKRGDGLGKRIIGFPEHITSDIGSIGDFAASAEVAFGTILQRSYAVLGARMHYGHPDIMNKLYMMQQGGVSKATKTINLSEDIFAGMDFTLRGDGRQIHHREYFHLAKGRDMGFNAVLGFFSKLSSGTGEQILSRQTFRLGQVLHLPEALSFYYAHAGYYVNQFFVSISMPLLVFVWLLVLLSDCDETFLAYQQCQPGQKSAADVMAVFLVACFSWLVLLFLVANTMPLFCELWLQVNLKAAVHKFITSIITLSPLMFVFQAKTIGHYITNEIRFGGASYVATGRGLPTERRAFITKNSNGAFEGLYLDYANIAYYDGVMLLGGVIMVGAAGGTQLDDNAASLLRWTWLSVVLTIMSWLYAPFIFNPYNFVSKHFCGDMKSLFDFFFKSSGKNWNAWYERTLLKSRKGVARSMTDVGFFIAVLFLTAWYSLLNLKAQALTNIFSEIDLLNYLYAAILLPPFFGSLFYCTLVVLVENLAGCRTIAKAGLHTAQGWARERAEKAAKKAATACGTDAAVAPEKARTDLEQAGASGSGGEESAPDVASDDHEAVALSPKAGRPKLRPARSRIWADGVPLAISAIVVMILQIAESCLALWFFRWVGWHKAFLAGLILKWGLTNMCLFLAESILLTPHCLSVLTLPLHHWVRSNRIARDMLVSMVIALPLLPLVFLNHLNDYICPGCSAHQLLIYRDPGTVEREERVFDIDPDADDAEVLLAVAPEPESMPPPTSSKPAVPAGSASAPFATTYGVDVSPAARAGALPGVLSTWSAAIFGGATPEASPGGAIGRSA